MKAEAAVHSFAKYLFKKKKEKFPGKQGSHGKIANTHSAALPPKPSNKGNSQNDYSLEYQRHWSPCYKETSPLICLARDVL